MGKGDKKTKRGKIIIGSAGVRRSRKKKGTKPHTPKAGPKPVKEVEEAIATPVKTAPKKARKAEEVVEGAETKPKTPKARKKKTEEEAGPEKEAVQE